MTKLQVERVRDTGILPLGKWAGRINMINILLSKPTTKEDMNRWHCANSSFLMLCTCCSEVKVDRGQERQLHKVEYRVDGV